MHRARSRHLPSQTQTEHPANIAWPLCRPWQGSRGSVPAQRRSPGTTKGSCSPAAAAEPVGPVPYRGLWHIKGRLWPKQTIRMCGCRVTEFQEVTHGCILAPRYNPFIKQYYWLCATSLRADPRSRQRTATLLYFFFCIKFTAKLKRKSRDEQSNLNRCVTILVCKDTVLSPLKEPCNQVSQDTDEGSREQRQSN